MNKRFLLFVITVALLGGVGTSALAQGTVKTGPAVERDSDLEKDGLHNLEVARHYFKQKKAYLAALQRCEEVIAGNPTFSRIDEILFIAGESSLRLSEGKGKQPAKTTPAKLRDDARDYLSQLVTHYPDSVFRKEGEADLKTIGGPKSSSSPD
jgi:outer membrane protein assembly factor BamD (BamD/ComL family)